MAGEPPPIPVGSRVVLQGLQGAPHLNGATGEVTGPPAAEPETDPPRYPVRLLAPRQAVAAHPQGVRVRLGNLQVTQLPEPPRLTKLCRSKAATVPLAPEHTGAAVAAFLQALEADTFPEEGLGGLFGVAMPAGGRDTSDSEGDMRRCKIGQLALGAWQELMRALYEQRLGSAVQAYGGAQKELDFALMTSCIGGLDALRAMGGARGPQLAAVAEAARRELCAHVEGALRGGDLPGWYEAEVRHLAAAAAGGPAGPPPYCSELVRRGFARVPWDTQALERMKA